MKEKFEDGKKREDAGNNKLFTRMMEKVDAGCERIHEQMEKLDRQGVTKLRVVPRKNTLLDARDEKLDHS